MREKRSDEYKKGYMSGYTAGRNGFKPKGGLKNMADIKPLTCTNDAKDYAEFDQFVCSRCGIHLEDWKLIDESDIDNGITHDYVFKFCPNCGARVKGADMEVR